MNIRNFLLAAMLIGVSAFSGMAFAQDANGAGGRGRLSFLSADDRQHLFRVRQQVLNDNPDLKTEQASLMKERAYVKNKEMCIRDRFSRRAAVLRNPRAPHPHLLQLPANAMIAAPGARS